MYSFQQLFLGQRSITIVHPNPISAVLNQDKMILDKVLNDDRKTALVETVMIINDYWLDCQECNWYKSEAVFREARLVI